MDYQQRIRSVLAHINEFLKEYQPPAHLSENTVKIAKIRTIAEAVNSSLPEVLSADAISDVLKSAFIRVAKSHRGKEWPEPQEFVKVLYSGPAPESAKRDGSGEIDSAAINAKRILAGEAVGEEWLWGTKCHEMISKGLLAPADLEKHRSALFLGCRDLHGEDEALAREARHKRLHERVAVGDPGNAPSAMIAREIANRRAM